MNGVLKGLAERYAQVLENYLIVGGESTLREAYELGRKALVDGAGVLDIVATHDATIRTLQHQRVGDLDPDHVIARAHAVLAECVSPFEMVLRGFREANDRLRQSFAELSEVEEELRRQNRALAAAHAEVEAARSRYQRLFEFAPDGYVVTDLKGRIREANSAASSLLGTPAERLLGNSILDFVVLHERDSFRQQFLLLQSGQLQRKEDWQLTFQPDDRSPIPVSLTADIELGPHQRIAGLRWLLRDATEQRRAEAERAQFLLNRAEAEAARRLAFLAEASAVLSGPLDDESKLATVARLALPYLADWCLVFVTDPDGALLQSEIAVADRAESDLAEEIRRLSSVQKLTPFWRAVDSAKILEQFEDIWSEPLPDSPCAFLEAIRRIEVRSMIAVPLTVGELHLGALILISTKSGRRYSEVERTLAHDLGRRCALAVENARLYREVIRERDIAATANRAKDQFLAVLSHELRNPLMPVAGWTRILSRHPQIQNDPELAEGVRALERGAQTLKRLVEDCLDLARISQGKITLEQSTMDLNHVLVASAESVRQLAGAKRARLDLELCPEPLWVLGDVARLQQVVVNLLINAVKYSEPGAMIVLRSCLQNSQAGLTVRDSGIGIEPELLDKIFQPFHQGIGFSLTSESGLGLGLSIARQIVNLHGGQIWAESPGRGLGSAFHVLLPLAPAPDFAVPPDQIAPSPRDSGRSQRVLLVEDASDVIFLLRTGLEHLGYSVLQAQNGHMALDLASREPPDAVVSDIKMPAMDGLEFIRRLRMIPALRTVPAIALTGFAQKGDIEKALAAGFDACLAKPTEVEELAALIRQLGEERTASHGGE